MKCLTYKPKRIPWNKGKLIGQKLPFAPKQVCAIRTRLEIKHKTRDLALFNLGIDSKLRSCDLVKIRVQDISHGTKISTRAIIMQQKTKHPVQFELTENTRNSLMTLITSENLKADDFIFKSRIHDSDHLSTRQYARIVKSWALDIGIDPINYGTHSMRRTKVTALYHKNKNIRAIQLLLGHSKIESTVRYLGVELDDALNMSENIDL